VVDLQFSDAGLAALYDLFCPWEQRRDFSFYLPLVMSADAVLDVGCGTGALLHRARESGHSGRLCGLDPADGMLRQARRRSDIEWVHGDLGGVFWDREFDLVVMTGHAFQVLLEDDEIRTALGAVRSALVDGGHFAFETRNPLAREWERWTSASAVEVVEAGGPTVQMVNEAKPVDGEVVSFTTTFTSSAWAQPRTSRSTLRFLDAGSLSRFLPDAGLTIEWHEQSGKDPRDHRRGHREVRTPTARPSRATGARLALV
jgi:ubiquinone/menaquinone biosynthesis C-methylase UbiE